LCEFLEDCAVPRSRLGWLYPNNYVQRSTKTTKQTQQHGTFGTESVSVGQDI
jgi:hypothetical protein